MRFTSLWEILKSAGIEIPLKWCGQRREMMVSPILQGRVEKILVVSETLL